MKRLALILLGILSLFTISADARVRVSFDFFYDTLSPMGNWYEVEDYGYVWSPRGVDSDWSPYADGYWSFTDAGWTWVSYEDWGGITYHYGRWVMLDDYGWCWVPGYEWGPAWVSWRRSDDYVGWAPLPPEARWERQTGFGVWVDVNFNIGPGWFRFCRVQDFGAPVLRHVFVPRTRNVTIIHQTVNITNISYRDDYGYAFNGGIDYDWIAPRCERPVPALKLVQNTTNIFLNNNQGNVFINTARGNQLIVLAPPVAERDYAVPTRKPAVVKNITKPVISRGWAGLDKDAVRENLLIKMRDETRGLTPQTAPARAVKASQVAVVPKVADEKATSPTRMIKPVRREESAAAPPSPERHGNDLRPAVAVKPQPMPQESKPGGLRPERGGEGRETLVKPVSPSRETAVEKPLRPSRDSVTQEREAKPQEAARQVTPRINRESTQREAAQRQELEMEQVQKEQRARQIALAEREAAQSAARKREADMAARQQAAEQAARQRAVEDARRSQEAAILKQRRQQAEIEGARRSQEQAERAARTQQMQQEAARRAADEQRRMVVERQQAMARQQAAEASRQRAEEAARRAEAAQAAQAMQRRQMQEVQRQQSIQQRPQVMPQPQRGQPVPSSSQRSGVQKKGRSELEP